MSKRESLVFITFLFVIGFYIFSYSLVGISEEKKEVKLTTCDLNKPYKIVSVIVYRSGVADLNKINDELKKQAKKMKANYVIGIRYFEAYGYLYGYGTAVTTK